MQDRSSAAITPVMRYIKSSLAAKLYGGFGLVLLIFCAVVAFSITTMGSLSGRTNSIGTVDLPSTRLIGTIDTAESDYRTAQLQHVIAPDEQGLQEWEGKMKESDALIHKTFDRYAPLISVDEDRRDFEAAKRQWDDYVKASAAAVALSRQFKNKEAMALLNGELRKGFDASAGQLGKWAQFNVDSATASVKHAKSAASSARSLMLALALLGFVIAGAVAFLVTRGIKRGVDAVLDRLQSLRDRDVTDLSGGLRSFADGDLTVDVVPATKPIEQHGSDEIGQVASAVNDIRSKTVESVQAYGDARASLQEIIGQVSSTAGSLSASSQQMASTSDEAGKAVGEIASAVGDVAQGAERQVRVVASARAATDEVTAAVQQSAASAQETAQAAEEARGIARDGVGAAESATDAMRAVRESSTSVAGAIEQLASKSEQIGGIVATITGIAEQTNLLALNAAIEAARAGEQGRGFAVVAEEVRKLAEDSQNAAGQISGLIGEIQAETQHAVKVAEDGARRTDDGAATVEQTREAFLRIGGSVDSMSERTEQIAAAVQQIAANAERLSREIGEVASVAEQSSASAEQVSASTQQTSASTQEIAASAQELANTAEELDRLVGRFTVA
jgi:methyl-accepting chemotaxis protein